MFAAQSLPPRPHPAGTLSATPDKSMQLSTNAYHTCACVAATLASTVSCNAVPSLLLVQALQLGFLLPRQAYKVLSQLQHLNSGTCLRSSCFWHSSLATWSLCCSKAARSSLTSSPAASRNFICILCSCALYLQKSPQVGGNL